MSRKAFDKIAEGLREAAAIARDEARPAKLFVPAEIGVPAIRGSALPPEVEPPKPGK